MAPSMIGLPDVLGVLASADWALAPVVAIATAARRTVDLEIMVDMFGVCGGVGVRVERCVCACVWTWMYMSVFESFQNARREASSGLLSFRARTPTEDAYRGRPPFLG